MALAQSITALSLLSCLLSGLSFLALLRRAELRRLYPALLVFLGVRVVSDALLNVLMHPILPLDSVRRYTVYFAVYWLSFFVGTVAIFIAARQVLEAALGPLTGLKKAGRLLFRWVGVTCGILVVTTSFRSFGLSLRSLPFAMIELMRCVSLVELCLLAFLAFGVHQLGLSYRSHVFGVGLGLGLLAAIDMATAVWANLGTSMVSYFNLFGEASLAVVFLIWCVYFFKAAPERRTALTPAQSQLLRWNEIANAFGYRGGQVVLTPAPRSFFLQDVERMVDRAMTRNSIDA